MLKFLRKIVLPIALVYAALWGLTIYINYPNPVAAVRLGLANPSDAGKLMPAAEISALRPITWEKGPRLSEMEVTFQGEKIGLYDFLEATQTNAFLIVKNDQIVSEIYLNGFDEKSQLPSYSVAKSVVSILAGQLIAEGQMSESDTFVGWLPRFENKTAYDNITIAQLLDMSSGVAVADNYPDGPAGWGNPIAQMYATTDLNNFIMNHRDLYWAPGSDHEYRSVDTQMLGMILEEVTGKNLAALVTERLWAPLGMEHSATWNLDREGGAAKGFCCLNATARDFAKLGKALNDSIQAETFSTISPDWAQRMSTSVTTLDHGWGYGAFTWHPNPGANLYLGLHGQFVYTDAAQDVVIVKLSNSPTDEANPEISKVFAQLVEFLSESQ
jgi:CubicO group peptidase (beta-lactamase class C family)